MLNALSRITDSQAFTAVARHCFVAMTDPQDPELRLFLRAKNSVVRRDKATGFQYTIEEKVVDKEQMIIAPHVKWGKPEGRSANDVLAETHGGRDAEKLDRAMELLRDELKDGPKLAEKIKEVRERYNVSERTIDRAAKEMKVLKTKSFGEKSMWSLPP